MRRYFIRIVYKKCRRSTIKSIQATSEEEAIFKFEQRYYSRLHSYKNYYVDGYTTEEIAV